MYDADDDETIDFQWEDEDEVPEREGRSLSRIKPVAIFILLLVAGLLVLSLVLPLLMALFGGRG